jgi:hypothetical protein
LRNRKYSVGRHRLEVRHQMGNDVPHLGAAERAKSRPPNARIGGGCAPDKNGNVGGGRQRRVFDREDRKALFRTGQPGVVLRGRRFCDLNLGDAGGQRQCG